MAEGSLSPSSSVYIRGLDNNADRNEIESVLSTFGEIKKRIFYDSIGRPTCLLCIYEDDNSAIEAVAKFKNMYKKPGEISFANRKSNKKRESYSSGNHQSSNFDSRHENYPSSFKSVEKESPRVTEKFKNEKSQNAYAVDPLEAELRSSVVKLMTTFARDEKMCCCCDAVAVSSILDCDRLPKSVSMKKCFRCDGLYPCIVYEGHNTCQCLGKEILPSNMLSGRVKEFRDEIVPKTFTVQHLSVNESFEVVHTNLVDGQWLCLSVNKFYDDYNLLLGELAEECEKLPKATKNDLDNLLCVKLGAEDAWYRAYYLKRRNRYALIDDARTVPSVDIKMVVTCPKTFADIPAITCVLKVEDERILKMLNNDVMKMILTVHLQDNIFPERRRVIVGFNTIQFKNGDEVKVEEGTAVLGFWEPLDKIILT